MTREQLRAKIKEIEPNFVAPHCPLVGEDGNAFFIMGRVGKSLKRAGYPKLAKLYYEEAESGDYDHLLATSMEFTTEDED